MAVRIAISSSTFRRPLVARTLTQLEWVERCASTLAIDGIVADIDDFPRTDVEYVAQLRKVAIDLGLVPFGLEAAGLLEPDATAVRREQIVEIASALGASVIRTALPVPGDVPPATFVATVAAAKALSAAAKAANVTVVVSAAAETLGADLASIKHLLKDVDSAWLRAAPHALVPEDQISSKDRFPAFVATPADDACAVAERAERSWLLLDAPAVASPWELTAEAVAALRNAEAERRLVAGR